ncbi:bifunctional lytic transglycosylase/C40 family peptidase [Bacillus amyloliquefaciens]|uniref:bifunctional lytic transglycosylase/C40 family peptidase n=1 Tax=Bacillus amyloliquefaciens TaxID=1390 RepID=UPI002809CE5F|nr:NlpC/P60 family protein [Bacillus amyloliquefaciens]MDQ8094900.1 NlpC/P60 family protein [Bacillus amyloliquefaciens]
MSTSPLKPVEMFIEYKIRKYKLMVWGTIASIIAILLLVGIVAVTLFSMFTSVIDTSDESSDQTYSDIQISSIGENEIPKEYIPLYKKAGEKYHVPWTLLAAIHRIETRFGTLKHQTSSVGARGPLQFMVKTWLGWGYHGGTAVGDADIPDKILSDPKMIKKYGGYGVDGNGDGKADISNVEDAVYSAAHYLSANGASSGNVRQAVFTYNHAGWYVNDVMEHMDLYGSGKAKEVSISNKGKPAIEEAIKVGSTIIDKSPYNWGGGRTQSDIDRKSFDCSSFIYWIFSKSGVNLGDQSSVTTDSLVKLGKSVSKDELKRGDLVFFDTYKVNGHVGIYLGNGEFLNDNSSNGVSIDKMNNPYWSKHFKGIARRIVE